MPRAHTLVQITDPHLHGHAEDTLLGMNTERSLKLVLELVQSEVADIDLIIATGDIAQDSSLQAYQNFLSFLAPLPAPMRWIPGNHDNPSHMAIAGKGLDHAEAIVDLGEWVVVLLDSTVTRRVHGHLAADQLAILEQALIQYADRHVLVTFHHHSVSLQSRWIDQIGVRNNDELKALLDQHSCVRAVVCGHVHQASDQVVAGVRYLSTPSTCVQFQPLSQDFGIDPLWPGYRKLVLNPDGTIDTAVSRIDGVDFDIDFSQTGY